MHEQDEKIKVFYWTKFVFHGFYSQSVNMFFSSLPCQCFGWATLFCYGKLFHLQFLFALKPVKEVEVIKWFSPLLRKMQVFKVIKTEKNFYFKIETWFLLFFGQSQKCGQSRRTGFCLKYFQKSKMQENFVFTLSLSFVSFLGVNLCITPLTFHEIAKFVFGQILELNAQCFCQL